MRTRRSATLTMAAACLGVAFAACRPASPGPAATVVRQVDHVVAVSPQARALFVTLTETFRLPVAWPMAAHGGFTSGGVSAGNVHLEVVAGPAAAAGGGESRWTGMALEPGPLEEVLPAMDARGIRHGAPAPFRSNPFTTRWTTVALPEVSGAACEVFLCEYGHDVRESRRGPREELQSRDGGPLAVRGVEEVVLGVRDLDGARRHWGRLLDPVPESPEGVWRPADGPAIRLVRAEKDGIAGLVVGVRSLSLATRALRERGVAVAGEADRPTLAGPVLGGLGITLVERP